LGLKNAAEMPRFFMPEENQYQEPNKPWGAGVIELDFHFFSHSGL
jgi:hypothetical protein